MTDVEARVHTDKEKTPFSGPVASDSERPISARLESGLNVGQIDPSCSLFDFLRVLRTSDALVVVNRAGLILNPSALEDLFSCDVSNPIAIFQVQVNPSKKLSLYYVRLDCRLGSRQRLKAMAVYGLLRLNSSLERLCDVFSESRLSFMRRLARRARVAGNSTGNRIQAQFLSATSTTNQSLNSYVLTSRFDEIPEFSFPAALHVALTKNCNLACIMCPYHSEDLRAQHKNDYFARGERLPESILAQLIEEAGRHGAHLSFGQYDEPFIYKHFARWAVQAKEAGCTVSITTNGTLLDEAAAQMLIEAGIDQISFSLDAASHDTYRKIRLDDFDIPLRNLRMLVSIRNKLHGKTKLRACLVVQDQNKHEEDQFYDLIDGLGLDMVSFYSLTTYSKGIWFNPVLNFALHEDVPEFRSVCSQLYDQMAIYPDGNVALCCLTTMYVGYRDDVPYVGNLKDFSLKELWHSELYRNIRAEAFKGKFSNSVCRDCTIWHNYQGKMTISARGHKMYQNAYESVIYLR